jgi:1-acyl-sn-glycerol-3-phosphate acyltransferase
MGGGGGVSALYAFGKTIVAPVLRAAWRPRVSGVENIPHTGPVILAANHLSMVDSIVLPVVVPRPVYFLAKSQYFQNPALRWLLTSLNNIPVDRSGVRDALMAIDAAVPMLRAGQVLGIFAEGTRSPDGRLYRGRPGVAKLALDTGAVVVPVGLIGTERIHPIGRRIVRLSRADVVIGEPVDLSPWAGEPPKSKVYREIMELVMREIGTLSGQEYVGRYAPRRSEPA